MDFPEPDNFYEDRKDAICEVVRLVSAGHVVAFDSKELEPDRSYVLRVDDDFHDGIFASDLSWAINQGYLNLNGGVLSLGPNVGKLQCP